MKKRNRFPIFAALLFLILMAVPVSAASKNVCKIGSKNYASLQKAVDAAKSGQTITMLKAVTAKDDVVIRKKVTINFNGKKYTFKSSDQNAYAFRIEKKTTTIKNMNMNVSQGFNVERGAGLTLNSGTYTGGRIANGGTLTIKGGTYNIRKNGVDNQQPQIHNFGTARITGGKFNRKADIETAPHGEVVHREMMWNNGVCTISKGTFKSSINSCGTLTIKGGTFSYGIYTDKRTDIQNPGKGKLTITGGTIKNTEGPTLFITNNATANIKGGKFENKNGVCLLVKNGANVTVTGGTFNGGQPSQISDKGTKCTIKNGSFKNTTSSPAVVFTEGSAGIISGGNYQASNGPSMRIVGADTTCTVEGGHFNSINVFNKATLILNGGEDTDRLQVSDPGSKVIINNYTINAAQRTLPEINAAIYITDQASAVINGGAFSNPAGYGYALLSGGTVSFGVSDPASLFNVKELLVER